MLVVFIICDLLVFMFCTVLFPKSVAHQEGKNCSYDGYSCTSIYKCDWAIQQIQQRRQVNTCRFEGKVPFVCCPNQHVNQTENSTNKITMKPVEVTETIMSKVTIKNPGSLSMKKCNEYWPVPGSSLIIAGGGVKSHAKEFAHMAALGFGTENDKQWKCGGSLISLKHVLTAAHCIYSTELGEVKFVRLGDLNIDTDKDNTEPQDFNVKKFYQHPDFNSLEGKNDIAIIELDKEVSLTKYVRPACLNVNQDIDEDSEITATGWGNTEYTGSPSSHLLKVYLRVISNEDCKKEYKNYGARGKIDDKQICAKSADDKKLMDTCQGDSGGPLQYINYKPQKHYHIFGITSFGKACVVTDSAGVYTRVSSHLDWIESIAFA